MPTLRERRMRRPLSRLSHKACAAGLLIVYYQVSRADKNEGLGVSTTPCSRTKLIISNNSSTAAAGVSIHHPSCWMARLTGNLTLEQEGGSSLGFSIRKTGTFHRVRQIYFSFDVYTFAVLTLYTSAILRRPIS